MFAGCVVRTVVSADMVLFVRHCMGGVCVCVGWTEAQSAAKEWNDILRAYDVRWLRASVYVGDEKLYWASGVVHINVDELRACWPSIVETRHKISSASGISLSVSLPPPSSPFLLIDDGDPSAMAVSLFYEQNFRLSFSLFLYYMKQIP